jgi:hypothetical protein
MDSIKSKKTRKSKRGGKRIGKGMRGTVYSPPLKCAEGDDDKWSSTNFVSKDINDEFLELEYKNSFLVKELDPGGEWSITAQYACTIRDTQEETNWVPGLKRQLIFKNGGNDLYSLLLKPGQKGDVSKYINGLNDDGHSDITIFEKLDPVGIKNIIRQLHKILPSLDILNTKYIHGDLHFGNIVTDGVPRLIDFSNLESVADRKKKLAKSFSECFHSKTGLGCDLLNARIDALNEDVAKAVDVKMLWFELYILLESKWVQTVFPDKFKTWLKKYRDLGRLVQPRSDYIASILYASLY